MRAACVMPQMLEIALPNVARTSPTLPPSAISTSAMSGRLPRAGQHHADILEDRGDRRVRLVHGDLDRADARKRRHHVGIGHGVGEAIGVRGLRQIGGELKIDHEALADLGLMFHHAMAGMNHDAGDEYRIGHCCFPSSLMAAATRSAWTVSATSWARMIRAPFSAATRCAAIEPPSR